MKKFEIKKAHSGSWLASHNEFPKFACQFEYKKFYHKRTVTRLSNPSGDLNEISAAAENGKMAQAVP